MLEGILPIGSVVLLTNSTKRVMIIGVCQKQVNVDREVYWDYVGCVYPEGYMGGEKTFLFNHDQIIRVFALGYLDEEQFEFMKKANDVIKQLREMEK